MALGLPGAAAIRVIGFEHQNLDGIYVRDKTREIRNHPVFIQGATRAGTPSTAEGVHLMCLDYQHRLCIVPYTKDTFRMVDVKTKHFEWAFLSHQGAWTELDAGKTAWNTNEAVQLSISAQEEPWLFDELQLEGPRKRFLDRSNQNIGPPGMPTIAEVQSKRARLEVSSAKSSASGSKGSKDRTNKDQDPSLP